MHFKLNRLNARRVTLRFLCWFYAMPLAAILFPAKCAWYPRVANQPGIVGGNISGGFSPHVLVWDYDQVRVCDIELRTILRKVHLHDIVLPGF